MEKPGITIDIPGFGERHIRIAVSDYTGTHSFGGVIEPDVKRKLRELAAVVDLHIITADSFGTAERELAGIAIPYKLRSGRHDIEKAEFVSQFDLQHVAAFGNGRAGAGRWANTPVRASCENLQVARRVHEENLRRAQDPHRGFLAQHRSREGLRNSAARLQAAECAWQRTTEPHARLLEGEGSRFAGQI